MSVSNDNLIEIDMIKQLIRLSTHNEETKKSLLEIFNTIIAVADKIEEWTDYILPEDYKEIASSTSEDEDLSDGDYTPEDG